MLSPLSVLAFALLELVHPAGLTFTHRNSPTSQKYLPETMGGGVALLDYNNDGLLDIFFVNSGHLADPQTLPADFHRRDPRYWNRLFRQNANGSFTDVTAPAGLSQAPNAYGMGVAAGDYDNNGFPDLYVTNYGANTLYRNNGDGTFTDVTGSAGVAASGWSVSAGFLDYDNDGRLDLFVARYLDYHLDKNVLCGTPFLAYCRPDKYKGVTNVLFHNEGSGRFRDVTQPSHIGLTVSKGMGVAINDYDADGFPDIFVSVDLEDQLLFHNNRNGTFDEQALAAGVALSGNGNTFSGMGAAFADYDNDNRPDLLVTNLALEKWPLYRNLGNGSFADATLPTGLAALIARNSGWGVGLHDFDNDGWKDIFAAQSHVLDNVERMNSALRYLEPPGLYRNNACKFEKNALASLPPIAGRGAAFGDIDNDGALDVVLTVLNGEPLVLKGTSNANHWLTLNLQGTASNRDGQGARIKVENQSAYATTAGSYLSASDRRVHLGLGASKKATIEILWPSGKKQTLSNITADQILNVKEPR